MGNEENDTEEKTDGRIGNQFWLQRSSSGRAPIFDDPAKLWDMCCEYFQWVEDSPLMESKMCSYQGTNVLEDVPKMRAMTLDGLYLFLDICRSTWDNYREKKDFLAVTTQVESVIRSQKFAGAAADLLNANIIARDLGLKDASSKELTGPNGSPLGMVGVIDKDTTAEDAAKIYAQMVKGNE